MPSLLRSHKLRRHYSNDSIYHSQDSDYDRRSRSRKYHKSKGRDKSEEMSDGEVMINGSLFKKVSNKSHRNRSRGRRSSIDSRDSVFEIDRKSKSRHARGKYESRDSSLEYCKYSRRNKSCRYRSPSRSCKYSRRNKSCRYRSSSRDSEEEILINGSMYRKAKESSSRKNKHRYYSDESLSELSDVQIERNGLFKKYQKLTGAEKKTKDVSRRSKTSGDERAKRKSDILPQEVEDIERKFLFSNKLSEDEKDLPKIVGEGRTIEIPKFEGSTVEAAKLFINLLKSVSKSETKTQSQEKPKLEKDASGQKIEKPKLEKDASGQKIEKPKLEKDASGQKIEKPKPIKVISSKPAKPQTISDKDVANTYKKQDTPKKSSQNEKKKSLEHNDSTSSALSKESLQKDAADKAYKANLKKEFEKLKNWKQKYEQKQAEPVEKKKSVEDNLSSSSTLSNESLKKDASDKAVKTSLKNEFEQLKKWKQIYDLKHSTLTEKKRSEDLYDNAPSVLSDKSLLKDVFSLAKTARHIEHPSSLSSGSVQEDTSAKTYSTKSPQEDDVDKEFKANLRREFEKLKNLKQQYDMSSPEMIKRLSTEDNAQAIKSLTPIEISMLKKSSSGSNESLSDESLTEESPSQDETSHSSYLNHLREKYNQIFTVEKKNIPNKSFTQAPSKQDETHDNSYLKNLREKYKQIFSVEKRNISHFSNQPQKAEDYFKNLKQKFNQISTQRLHKTPPESKNPSDSDLYEKNKGNETNNSNLQNAEPVRTFKFQSQRFSSSSEATTSTYNEEVVDQLVGHLAVEIRKALDLFVNERDINAVLEEVVSDIKSNLTY